MRPAIPPPLSAIFFFQIFPRRSNGRGQSAKSSQFSRRRGRLCLTFVRAGCFPPSRYLLVGATRGCRLCSLRCCRAAGDRCRHWPVVRGPFHSCIIEALRGRAVFCLCWLVPLLTTARVGALAGDRSSRRHTSVAHNSRLNVYVFLHSRVFCIVASPFVGALLDAHVRQLFRPRPPHA